MVGAKGFEPSTPPSRTVCATRLRHAPTKPLVRGSPPRNQERFPYYTSTTGPLTIPPVAVRGTRSGGRPKGRAGQAGLPDPDSLSPSLPRGGRSLFFASFLLLSSGRDIASSRPIPPEPRISGTMDNPSKGGILEMWEKGSGEFTGPSAHAKGPFVGALICPLP